MSTRRPRGGAAGGRRPLARDRARFGALLAERAPLYDSVADAVLLDSAREVVRRAVPALQRLAETPPGTRMIWADRGVGRVPRVRGRGADRLPSARSKARRT